ncbi:YciI family protein [Bacillus sp. JCM 19041]|uniref:YciI family protein n=1 Tax=Bacillus sp. JCM 19041 TaxID=1460637 RepID=UPI0006D1492C
MPFFLPMKDEEKSRVFREDHLQFLAALRKSGDIAFNGRFLDGTGGLVIYKADSYEKVLEMVKKDPYVQTGARSYEVHEWELVVGEGVT